MKKTIKWIFEKLEITNTEKASELLSQIMTNENVKDKLEIMSELTKMFEHEMTKIELTKKQESEMISKYFANKIEVIDPVFLKPIKK